MRWRTVLDPTSYYSAPSQRRPAAAALRDLARPAHDRDHQPRGRRGDPPPRPPQAARCSWSSTSSPRTAPAAPRGSSRCAAPGPEPLVADADAFAGAPLPRPRLLQRARRRATSRRSSAPASPTTRTQVAALETTWGCTLASLLGVDRGVARIWRELGRIGERRNTLLAFTSDNGLYFGEHRLSVEKTAPYLGVGRGAARDPLPLSADAVAPARPPGRRPGRQRRPAGHDPRGGRRRAVPLGRELPHPRRALAPRPRARAAAAAARPIARSRSSWTPAACPPIRFSPCAYRGLMHARRGLRPPHRARRAPTAPAPRSTSSSATTSAPTRSSSTTSRRATRWPPARLAARTERLSECVGHPRPRPPQRRPPASASERAPWPPNPILISLERDRILDWVLGAGALTAESNPDPAERDESWTRRSGPVI